jgi:CBS domain-containing protein
MATLEEVMSRELVVVGPTATVAEAATVMGTHHVGSALVMEEGRLLGIFTERDVLRAVGSTVGAEGLHVREAMTADPETADLNVDAGDALDLMLERGFRHLPVVHDGRVVGVVSIRDVLQSRGRG